MGIYDRDVLPPPEPEPEEEKAAPKGKSTTKAEEK